MARYYFHLCDGIDVLLDAEGRELEAENLAQVALAEARAMIAADALAGHIYLDQKIEIHDEQGKMVYRLDFEDALQVTHEAVAPRKGKDSAR